MLKTLLGEKLSFDWKVTLVTILSTLLLMVDYYHKFFPEKWMDRTILYFVIPMLVILFIFRESPAAYGLSLGDWKAGLTLSLLAVFLIAPILLLVGRGDPSMVDYYIRFLPGLPWNTFADLLGWEFFFRGWILFTYARRYGPDALWLHAVPFSLAHISKPEIETLSTIFGGFAFGWVAWRTKSFIYPLLIHWFVSTFTILAASGSLDFLW